ncbi:glycoside hydrolase family 73 protein [Romboutsia maritimum]|nr:glucosaminidase domain-containing protein [Romboutsia maritimum]
MIPIILLLLTSLLAFWIKLNSLKEINKQEINVQEYIENVDEVSNFKVQVNWKYVASIIAVLNDNKFDNVSKEEIKRISNLFIESDNQKYTSHSLDDVLNKLDLSDNKQKRVKNYVEDLNGYGLMPTRLNSDGKYMKFINKIKESAIENYNKYHILPSITIAQAILESNWGESELSTKYNNLFGIKANSSWKGKSILIETGEFYNQVIMGKFRVYNNNTESISDHAKFLSENTRYKQVFNESTYLNQAEELQNAGYSTAMDEQGNHTYKKLLVQIIRQYNLQIIDSNVSE